MSTRIDAKPDTTKVSSILPAAGKAQRKPLAGSGRLDGKAADSAFRNRANSRRERAPALQMQQREDAESCCSLNALDDAEHATEPSVQRAVASASGHDFGQVPVHNGTPVMVQRQTGMGGGERESDEQRNDEGRREIEEEEGAGPVHTLVAQTKRMIVGRPGDRYEREADRVADQVLREGTDNPLAALYRSDMDVPLATKPLPIQRVANRPGPRTMDISPNHSGGKALDRVMQRDMESRFGHSFANVRLSDDDKAHRMAEKLNARAFTIGNTIHFGKGEYNPTSREGKRLLAHELTHVVQQGHAEPVDAAQDGGKNDIIPASTLDRAVQRGVVNRAQLDRLPRKRIKGDVETTRTSYELPPTSPAGVVQRRISHAGENTMIQLTNGGGGSSKIRAEGSAEHIGPIFNLYKASAFVEATPESAGCKFVDGSVTGDKTTVGGLTVSVGVTTERGPSKHNKTDESCETNSGKQEWVRYYLHFAAVQGIGVSVSETAGVSGTWITAQHDHTVDLKIYPNGRASADVHARRTKGPGGDRIRLVAKAGDDTDVTTITF